MNGVNPEGWGRQALRAAVLILVIAFATHWAYELLRPVVPFVASGAIAMLIVMAVLRRRRW